LTDAICRSVTHDCIVVPTIEKLKNLVSCPTKAIQETKFFKKNKLQSVLRKLSPNLLGQRLSYQLSGQGQNNLSNLYHTQHLHVQT